MVLPFGSRRLAIKYSGVSFGGRLQNIAVLAESKLSGINQGADDLLHATNRVPPCELVGNLKAGNADLRRLPEDVEDLCLNHLDGIDHLSATLGTLHLV